MIAEYHDRQRQRRCFNISEATQTDPASSGMVVRLASGNRAMSHGKITAGVHENASGVVLPS